LFFEREEMGSKAQAISKEKGSDYTMVAKRDTAILVAASESLIS
jgi:hypothetical protein